MNFDEILNEIPDDIREISWEDQGLVGQFKLDLKHNDVEIEEGTGNACILKKGEVSVAVLIYQYTPQNRHTEDRGFWDVGQKMVEGMQRKKKETGSDWGVVFLLGTFEETTLNVGFWVTSEDFIRDRARLSIDSKGAYKVNLRDFEDERILSKKISTVEDFLRLSGLAPTDFKIDG